MSVNYLIIGIIIILGLSYYLLYVKPKKDPLNKAVELAKSNNLLEAITEYKKILYTKPDAFDVHYRIAELYSRLQNYDQAVFHLNEVIQLDKYNLEVQKIKVLRKLAQVYYYIDNVEKAFQTYFNILKIEPEDPEAHYHIAFIALGQEEFDIAMAYFEKLVKIRDDFESFFGAGICAYQNKKNADAVNYFKEALSIKQNSEIATLALAFALKRTNKHNEAINFLEKLSAKVTGDEVIYVSKRLSAFLNIEAGRNEEATGSFSNLLSFTKEKDMTEEIKLSLYDLGFAYVNNKMLEQADKYWDELYNLDKDYENIRELLSVVKMDINKAHGGDGFERSIFDFVDDWKANSFSENFLWNICGLRSEKFIDIKNIVVPAKISKRKDLSRPGQSVDSAESEERIVNFCNLDNEAFRMISNRLVIKLGNKVNEILNTYRESDGVDILALTEDTKEKVLVWVRRWQGSKVGEITLRNFAQAINDARAKKGFFITSTELTDAAQNSLDKLSKVNVIYPSDLNELLKGLT